MSNKKSSSLVSTLRFPEFREAGEWVEKKLGEIAPLQRGFDLPSDKIKKGDIPVVYSNGIQNFHNIGMAKAPGLMTGRSGTIGKVHFIEEGDYWPHNTSLWVTNFNGNFPKFIYYLYININIARFASGSGVPTLNRNYVHEFHTSLPSSTEEQQKIAACLSSLDELITAHSQKLNALKKHKKGLMQQLFPAEGETVPTLRFPEFRDAGEWVEKSLGEIISLEYGSPLPEQKRNGGLIPVVGSNGIVGYHDNALVNAPAIVVGRKGSAGQINWIVSDCYPIDTTFYVKNKDSQNYLMFFLKLTLEKSKLEDFKDNGAVPGINRNEIYSIKMALPSLPEQQKIAACLSSLDELITAHSQKLDALKKHKKGLMQQLFPSTHEE